MNITDLFKKRDELTKRKDVIFDEINAVYEEVQSSFLMELEKVGIFNAEWNAADDLSNSLETSFFLADRELVDKCIKVAKKYFDIGSYYFAHADMPAGNGVLDICGSYPGTVVIRFNTFGKTKCDPAALVKHYGLNVNTSFYDDKIKDIQKRIDRLFP